MLSLGVCTLGVKKGTKDQGRLIFNSMKDTYDQSCTTVWTARHSLLWCFFFHFLAGPETSSWNTITALLCFLLPSKYHPLKFFLAFVRGKNLTPSVTIWWNIMSWGEKGVLLSIPVAWPAPFHNICSPPPQKKKNNTTTHTEQNMQQNLSGDPQ